MISRDGDGDGDGVGGTMSHDIFDFTKESSLEIRASDSIIQGVTV